MNLREKILRAEILQLKMLIAASTPEETDRLLEEIENLEFELAIMKGSPNARAEYN